MIVSNATPLIYLAKTGNLELLKSVFKQIYITEEVKNEVVDKGKKLGKKDAYIIEDAINQGWIKIEKTKLMNIPIEIDIGEQSTISLAKSMNFKEILIDEVSARTAAKILGLNPRGTLFVLLKSLKIGLINFDEFLEILGNLVKEGFRLREEIYLKAVEEAKKISKI